VKRHVLSTRFYWLFLSATDRYFPRCGHKIYAWHYVIYHFSDMKRD